MIKFNYFASLQIYRKKHPEIVSTGWNVMI